MPLTTIQPHTEAWHAIRQRVITATDMAAILGVSEYETALDIFLRKTGRVPPKDTTDAMKRGTRYEPIILADYAEERGVELKYPMPFVLHPALDILGCSPDAQKLSDGNLVEAKMSMSRHVADQLGEEGSDTLCEPWIVQAQVQMEVCNVEEVDFAVLLFGRLKIYNVKRNPKMGAIIRDAAVDFKHRIDLDDSPEPDFSNAHTPELVKNLYSIQDGKAVLLSDKCLDYWYRYKALGEEESALDKERKELQARIRFALGEAEIGIVSDPTFDIVNAKIDRKGYTVEATSYRQLKAVKIKAKR